jgi:cell wall-associated NlpC family hydrolase
MRMCAPGRHGEPPISRTAVRLAAVAITTSSLLTPYAPTVQAATTSTAPDPHLESRADRAARIELYAPPVHPAPDFVEVAIAPPAPPAPPIVQPAHLVRVVARRTAARPAKTRNGGTHYAVPAVSGTGADIAAYAETFLGIPYVYGAASRSGTDCSGLVLQVYAHFGIRLDHKASSFYGVGRAVSRADLQPGDIVVLNHGGHAGIYVGAGMIIHAPHTGDHVRLAPLAYENFSAARRLV